MTILRTIYCGNIHRLADGTPVGHPCRVLDPRYLEAEGAEDYLLAASILQDMPLELHAGIPSDREGRRLATG